MASTLQSQIESAETEWLASWKQGPTRIRWAKIPLQVGDQAPDFELQDSSGASVHLRDFWKDRPALLQGKVSSSSGTTLSLTKASV